MIVIYHQDNTVTRIQIDQLDFNVSSTSVVSSMVYLAAQHPEKIIIWCHELLSDSLDLLQIEKLFHHKKFLFSYHTTEGTFLDDAIGYVEESIFIKVNKNISYPTWQMSGDVGATHATVINTCVSQIDSSDRLDYFLNSLAKRAMPFGLLCYSEPKLLKKQTFINRISESGKTDVFRFVKQHYKTRWIFLLLLNLVLNEGRFPLGAFLKSIFYRKRNFSTQGLNSIVVESSKEIPQDQSIDVIIPTIGRSAHVHHVLKDLSVQTHLPVRVIIVEQNPQPDTQSELDFITTETWPFTVQHIFTHRAGACNARNICLSHTKSAYVFLADDDNRFESDLIENVFKKFAQFGNDVFQVAYPQANEKITSKPVFQYPFFGAGNAFLKRSSLENVSFDMGFEFGYGEDNDFGMQLRNRGFDVLYVSDFQIIHLKAPMGGFRTKPVLQWSNEKIQPKPSPTIMLYMLKHYTQQQIAGYRLNLLFKFYKHQQQKDPIAYNKAFQAQWSSSVFWAKKLMQ